jgi:hypothetical protein
MPALLLQLRMLLLLLLVVLQLLHAPLLHSAQAHCRQQRNNRCSGRAAANKRAAAADYSTTSRKACAAITNSICAVTIAARLAAACDWHSWMVCDAMQHCLLTLLLRCR